MLVISFTSFF